eukprot:363595-Chlamydomonas_euryale.AAC.6
MCQEKCLVYGKVPVPCFSGWYIRKGGVLGLCSVKKDYQECGQEFGWSSAHAGVFMMRIAYRTVMKANQPRGPTNPGGWGTSELTPSDSFGWRGLSCPELCGDPIPPRAARQLAVVWCGPAALENPGFPRTYDVSYPRGGHSGAPSDAHGYTGGSQAKPQ